MNMRVPKFIFTLLVAIILISCEEKIKTTKEVSAKDIIELDPKVDLDIIQTDFMTWWTYHFNNISLSSDFKGLNETSSSLSKKDFLERLTTGKFIVLKVKSDRKDIIYKLFKLQEGAEQTIISTIKSESLISLKHLKMEGSQFPEFQFTDLQGNTYANESLQGSFIILKTWFINCVACIEEFPELNEFVKYMAKNEDVVFLSIANDSQDKLKEFLTKKDFNYLVVPDQRAFITKTLGLQIYPTHIVIDKNGIIIKVVNKASEMISFIKNMPQL